MYFPLVHEFMKLTEMLGRVVLFMLFKYGKKSTHSSIVGTTLGKPGTTKKLKGANLRARILSISNQWSHQSILQPWSHRGERYAVRVCLVFVHHQRLDLIVVFSQGLPGVARSSHTEIVELRQWSHLSGVARCKLQY
jgi:hypothetical protein